MLILMHILIINNGCTGSKLEQPALDHRAIRVHHSDVQLSFAVPSAPYGVIHWHSKAAIYDDDRGYYVNAVE